MAYTSADKGFNEYCSSNVLTPTVVRTGSTTITTSNFYAFEHPLSIQWASTDLAEFTPRNAPILPRVSGSTTKSSSTGTSEAGRSRTGGSRPAHPANSGPSTGSGTYIGVGVGIGIACLVLLGLVVWFIIRRRRRRRNQASSPEHDVSPEQDAARPRFPAEPTEMAESSRSRPELGGAPRSEMENPKTWLELEGRHTSHPLELEGRAVHEM